MNNCIDMSNVNILNHKLNTFIYLRNTGFLGELDFSKCSYDDKEEFLKIYMTSGIENKSKILSSTWIEILFNDRILLDSILSKEEIVLFNKQNQVLIENMKKIMNSLILYSIERTFQIPLDEIRRDDFYIPMCNFSKLSEYKEFIYLLDFDLKDPVFFQKIFKDENNQMFLGIITDKLPFNNLLFLLDNKNNENHIDEFNQYINNLLEGSKS